MSNALAAVTREYAPKRRMKRMNNEKKQAQRCLYCDNEMKYVVLDMIRRTARLRCPTCDSEFPPMEEESDDDN